MSVYEEIFSKENTKDTIMNESDNWVNILSQYNDCVEKNIALAHIYYLREIYIFDCVDAEKACYYYEKIPIKYYSIDILSEYIDALKLCYRFDKIVELSRQIVNEDSPFIMKYVFLRELADSAIVTDGVITKEEYFEYKNNLKNLLTDELETIKRIVP